MDIQSFSAIATTANLALGGIAANVILGEEKVVWGQRRHHWIERCCL